MKLPAGSVSIRYQLDSGCIAICLASSAGTVTPPAITPGSSETPINVVIGTVTLMTGRA